MSGPQFSLEDLMGRDVKPWMPHKDAEHPKGIAGVVIKVTTVPSDYNETLVPVLEVVPDDIAGTIWRVTAYHNVLAREIAEQRPQQGDKIGIRYQGQKEGSRGPYESYRVVTERPEKPPVPIDWESIEKAARDELDDEPPEEEEEEEERF